MLLDALFQHLIRMAVMSHQHTIGFRKLREDLAEQTKLASSHHPEIDRLEKELAVKKKKKLIDEKALQDQKIKDVVSQRDSVKRINDASKGETSEARELIIQEWKDSQAGKDFLADMGLRGTEVATEVTLGKLGEALGKTHS